MKGLRSNYTSGAMNVPFILIWLLTNHFHSKEPGPPGKLPDSMSGTMKCKVSLEH